MKRNLFGFLCSILLSFLSLYADGSFGYMSYSTNNIGDDIQGIAAKRFLPKNSIPIDREFVSTFNRSSEVNTIMNGWFMHTKDCCWWSNIKAPTESWPPSVSINPLLISMHMTSHFFSNALTDEGMEYLREHGPVGTRDYYTLRELEKRGIPAYFSGCMCLTLENPFKNKRSNVIYAVDVSEKCVKYIQSKTKYKVVALSHGVPTNIQYDNNKRLAYAEMLLNQYRRARCVVTARLHATMPCLAFETPVLFIANPKAARFDGLGEHARTCSEQELMNGEVDFDFNNPPENPKTYLPIRENLIEVVTNWVRKHS